MGYDNLECDDDQIPHGQGAGAPVLLLASRRDGEVERTIGWTASTQGPDASPETG